MKLIGKSKNGYKKPKKIKNEHSSYTKYLIIII